VITYNIEYSEVGHHHALNMMHHATMHHAKVLFSREPGAFVRWAIPSVLKMSLKSRCSAEKSFAASLASERIFLSAVLVKAMIKTIIRNQTTPRTENVAVGRKKKEDSYRQYIALLSSSVILGSNPTFQFCPSTRLNSTCDSTTHTSDHVIVIGIVIVKCHCENSLLT